MKPTWERDGIQLYLGDCLEVLPHSPKVDAVVTDPPYFLPATHYSTRTGTSRSLSDLGILEHYFRDVFRVMSETISDSGCCYVFCDGQSYPVFFCTAYPNFKKQRPLIWDKLVAFNGYGWRHQHELILWCEKESSPSLPTGDGDILKFRAMPIDERDHLAQKPVDLICAILGKCGETILDPFMGSGTTGVACVKLGRKFIGIEKEPKYFEISVKRIERALSEERSSLFPLAKEVQANLFSEEAL